MIHDTAIIDFGADVHESAKIWHWTHVRDSAVIGADTSIGQCCYIAGIVGARCKIQNCVNLYEGVTVENEVFIGPSVTFTNDLHPRAVGEWEMTPTLIRRGASIGANATIRCGVEIGEWAMVGCGAVVLSDVAPHAVVAGVPARRTR
jgi:acetyltransferase-like isoleucine patch superfamily enzyme